MKQLVFGTAGSPICSEGRGTLAGIKAVNKLGLGAMELEFVRQVYVKEEDTDAIAKAAKKNNVVLTCHASYFINLNSLDKQIVGASRSRLLKAAKIANMCSAFSVCVHAAYRMKMSDDAVYANVKKQIEKVVSAVREEDNNIWVRPETVGKQSQFGTLKEILKLSSEIEGVMPCVDFAHMHAIEGKNNTYNEFAKILSEIEKTLGKEGIQNMHIHAAGINYGPKGERNHLNLEDSDMNYHELVKAWKDFRIKGVVISESPNIEEDALLLQKVFKG